MADPNRVDSQFGHSVRCHLHSLVVHHCNDLVRHHLKHPMSSHSEAEEICMFCSSHSTYFRLLWTMYTFGLLDGSSITSSTSADSFSVVVFVKVFRMLSW